MKQKKAILIGMFISFGLVLFIIGIYIVGKQQHIFGQSLKIAAVFNDIKGLKMGDKVFFSGIDIGTVSSIQLMTDTRVKTGFTVKRNVSRLIKKDSQVTIANEGLMGGKIVIILPGSDQSAPVEEGDILQTIEQVDVDEILKEVKKSSENISEVSRNLVDITARINRGEGIFGILFSDTLISGNLTKTSRDASKISGNLAAITEKVNRGQGMMGKLFTDTLFSHHLDTASSNLKIITGEFSEITQKVNAGEGVFGTLFTDTLLTYNLFLTSRNLEQTTRNLTEFTRRLNDNENAISRLVADTAFADSLEIMLIRLNTGIQELTKSSEAIQNSGLIRLFSGGRKDKEQGTKYKTKD